MTPRVPTTAVLIGLAGGGCGDGPQESGGESTPPGGRDALGGARTEMLARAPVQKRNPSPGPASFPSWFLVDPAKPFAPPATFETR